MKRCDYTVISMATHHCDGYRYDSNDFISVPATIKMPLVSGYTEPAIETQSAKVDNMIEMGWDG